MSTKEVSEGTDGVAVAPANESDVDEIDASRAPLLEHLIELRQRLVWVVVGLAAGFVVCFYFSAQIYDILLWPYKYANEAAGIKDIKVIFTAPHELFFVYLKVGLFGAIFITFPVLASQIYQFVAPGLYKNERSAFLPFLIATPFLFLLGALLAYFVVMPLALKYFIYLGQQASVGEVKLELLAKANEYLSFIMTLILAFGISFQLPVLLTLLAKAEIIGSKGLISKRKYAIVAVFVAAAVLTPPDIVTQIGLALPTLLLYELSIYLVKIMEKRRAMEQQKAD